MAAVLDVLLFRCHMPNNIIIITHEMTEVFLRFVRPVRSFARLFLLLLFRYGRRDSDDSKRRIKKKSEHQPRRKEDSNDISECVATAAGRHCGLTSFHLHIVVYYIRRSHSFGRSHTLSIVLCVFLPFISLFCEMFPSAPDKDDKVAHMHAISMRLQSARPHRIAHVRHRRAYARI